MEFTVKGKAVEGGHESQDNYQHLPGGPEYQIKRHCTDPFCCLLFTAFLVAYVGVAVVGYQNGDPGLLMYPFDSSGNQCGRPDTITADYKRLYYISPVEDLSLTVCVKECPTDTTTTVDCYPNKWVQDCSFKFVGNDTSVNYADPYPTYSMLSRFCIPTVDYIGDKAVVIDSKIKDQLSSAPSDVVACWPVIIYVALIAIGISIVYLIVMRYCVSVVLYVSIAAIFAGAIVFGYYLMENAKQNYSGKDQEDEYNKQMYISYACYAAAGLFAIIICFMWERIQLAIAIMKSAAGFVGDEFTVLLVPIISFFSTIGIIVFWLAALAFLYSTGEVVPSEKFNTFAAVKWDDYTRSLFYFELAGILWVNAFKIALVQFTIACSVLYWYFDIDMNFKFLHSLWDGARYHTGSLAFGSLILALVELVQIILTYIQKYLFKEDYAGNFAVKWLCSCISCLVYCFKRFIEYLNKNAYINIAFTSTSFCSSAWEVFQLMLENAARFLALGSIGTVFTFLGKGVITLSSAYLGYLIVTKDKAYYESISSPIPVLVIFVLISYVVGELFLSVYEMACDSIIIFFLHDEKIHPGQGAPHAPEPLKEFMMENRESSQPAVIAPVR